MKRKPAVPVPIAEIQGEFHKSEQEFESGFLESIHGLELNRVSVWGNVVRKFELPEKGFSSITLDDFTSAIDCNTFQGSTILNELKIGERIRVIGRVRQNPQGELYILAEIATPIDEQRELLHRAESLRTIQHAQKSGKKRKPLKEDAEPELKVEKRVM
ncbi:MAG: OB-fold nucleic acid binding domain-containing protein [Candidatus Diapherotrites archaeon]